MDASTVKYAAGEEVSAEHLEEQQRHLEAALLAVETLCKHLGALDTRKARVQVEAAVERMLLRDWGERIGRPMRDVPRP